MPHKVHSLECYTKVENECSPSGPICDALAPPSGNVPMTVTECGSDVTMCSLVTIAGTADNFTFKSQTASCVPKEDGAGFSSGCYERDDFEKISPDVAEGIKQIEALSGITFDTIEGCICDGNLCNGSIKFAFSISVIISSVMMSFMLFM
ncbi:hypothetical protein HOLleu_35130 [Holothuria leucospilota]|uniref:Uncharacterized protein n=1 Tax=Holothuria leucospilota TaxID=206669 RepID=A0A9Q1BFV7_HOLLE|nr:hypothetical protein HOLleu_35130 [Holothuria leucospilota]